MAVNGEVMDFGNLLVRDRTRGVVGKGSIVVRRELRGVHENRDVVVKAAVTA